MDAEIKQCQNCKKEFTIESEDFKFYEKIKVPPPTFCPECRFVRRLCFRNERFLYKRACDLCKKSIISSYDSGVSFPVYCPECWRSDAWEGLEYGKNYDFSKSFFEQWKELFSRVPRPSLFQIGNCLNVEYTHLIKDAKNVYLSYSVVLSENVWYSNMIDDSKEIMDSYSVTEGNLLYENLSSVKNYDSKYTYWSSNCMNCNFVFDCINCSNCFGCVNLRNKQYCIWNERYSREEYLEKTKNLNMGSHSFVQETYKRFWDLTQKFPRKYSRILNSVNSIGDDIRNCKNVNFAFYVYDSENTKFAYRCKQAKNSMDVCFMEAESAYEHASGGSPQSSNIKFIMNGCQTSNDIEYSDLCQSSSNFFGCTGIKSKKYCILNKQYGKDEYVGLINQIKKQMSDLPYIDKKGRVYKYGEFFPFELSPFGYNETLINDLFPLTKEEALQMGYNWKDKMENKYVTTKKAEEIPDDIKDVSDSILNETIECAITKKPFKINPSELQFYRRMNIPIPRIHQDERYKKRFMLKNPPQLWHRKCTKEGCQNEFETSYAPERPEIIYCECCYQQEVY